MSDFLLDTHAWLWLIQEARDEVTEMFFTQAEEWQKAGTLYLSPISCWEVGLLVEGKRVSLEKPIEDLWMRATEADSGRIAELTARVLIESTRLPGDIHKDPADRILVATARTYDMTLVTRDKAVLSYAKQGHLKARKP